jgi:hypothetical protein
MRRRSQSVTPVAKAGWDVEVSQARKASRGHNYYDKGEYDADPIPGQIAVRLTFNGKPTMTFGTLGLQSPDFAEKVTSMKAEAQERAAELNAVGAVA